MKRFVVWGVILIIGLGYVVYVSYPTAGFPEPLDDAVQSMEEADTETPLRRAYFTNHSREEVIEHYREEFGGWLTMRLNYPPEEAQTLIRDQTRSWYLEELVRPLRESVYINGFIPQVAKDDIWYKGEHFEAKITVRYVPSGIGERVVMAFLVLVMAYVLICEWKNEVFKLRNMRLKLW